MAELTQIELEAKIATIDAQIATIYASPTGIANYSIGQKSVSASQSLDGLIKSREIYQKLLDTYPAEDFSRLAIDVDATGADQTEYLGDEASGG